MSVVPEGAAPGTEAPGKVRAVSTKRLWRRLRERPVAMAGMVVAAIFIVTAAAAPVLAPYAPGAQNFDELLSAPSLQHPFGTDDLGRDVLSRVMWGARASLQAGVMAMLIAILAATPLGLIAGYYRGWLDSAIMRVVDALLAFPFLILAVGLTAILGPSLTNATVAIGVSSAPALIRIIRGEVLGVREEDYVDGAVAAGAPDWRVMARHILPNIGSTILVQATLLMPIAIIAEAALSFLGMGVQAPMPSWGVMLTAAQPFMRDAIWLAVFPGMAIFVATLAFNLLGDALRDILDPQV